MKNTLVLLSLQLELPAAPTSVAHQSPSPLSPFTLLPASPPHSFLFVPRGGGGGREAGRGVCVCGGGSGGRGGGEGGGRKPKGGIAAFQRRGRSRGDHRVMRGIKEKATLIFFFSSSSHFHHRENVKTGGLIYIYIYIFFP